MLLLASISAPVAALAGALAAALIGLVAQGLNHWLTIRRERRNAKRERLWKVVVDASRALYPAAEDEDKVRDDLAAAREEELQSIGQRTKTVTPVWIYVGSRSRDARSLLAIHFGGQHSLVTKYSNVASQVVKGLQEIAKLDPTEKEGNNSMTAIYDRSQQLRDDWMEEARKELDKI